MTSHLPPIAYHDATDPDEVHRLIRQAREQSPIAMGPYGPELLTYDLVRTVLRDSRFAMPQGIGLVVQGITSGPVWDRVCRLLISLNGAEHHRLRRLVSRAFTPRAAERMRAACIDVITELVDHHAAAGSCDMVTDIAQPYPIPIICALLGAPREDWRLFSTWASDISKAFGCNVAEETPAIVQAWEHLDAYIEELIARRRLSLGDDLISELIRAEDERTTGSRMTSWSALPPSCSTPEPTPPATNWPPPCRCSAQHPDQWELLAEHPELAPQAVDELIRHTPIIYAAARVATEDVELGGVVFPAGTYIVANTASANRDPAVYDDPERLDITREGAAGPDDLRRRRALLPRRSSGPGRTLRGAACDYPAYAQRSAQRPGPLEVADRTLRTHNASHRIRRRLTRTSTDKGEFAGETQGRSG